MSPVGRQHGSDWEEHLNVAYIISVGVYVTGSGGELRYLSTRQREGPDYFTYNIFKISLKSKQ